VKGGAGRSQKFGLFTILFSLHAGFPSTYISLSWFPSFPISSHTPSLSFSPSGNHVLFLETTDMNSRAHKRVRLFDNQNRIQEEEKDENQGDDARCTPLLTWEQVQLLKAVWQQEAVAEAEAARKKEEQAQPQHRRRLDYEQKGRILIAIDEARESEIPKTQVFASVSKALREKIETVRACERDRDNIEHVLQWAGKSLADRKQKNKGGAGKKTPGRGVKSAPREGRRGTPVRNAKYELAERKVFEWFAGQRVEGNRVTSRLIRVEMKLAVQVFYPVDGIKFRASMGWFRRFMRRHNLSFRRRNNKKEKSIAELAGRVGFFFDRVRRYNVLSVLFFHSPSGPCILCYTGFELSRRLCWRQQVKTLANGRSGGSGPLRSCTMLIKCHCRSHRTTLSLLIIREQRIVGSDR
jgi:hypothetical protein